MKVLLLAMALATVASAPAFAQAANDIASKLRDAHDYSQGRGDAQARGDSQAGSGAPSRHVRHRAHHHRRHHHASGTQTPMSQAPMGQAPMGQAPDAPAAH